MVTTGQYMRAERELTLRDWRRGWRIHAAIYAVAGAGH